MVNLESQWEEDLFSTCFDLVKMRNYKSNIPQLKSSLDELRTMMIQKTAGQRKNKPKDVNFDDLPRIKTNIIIESLCLYLSGDLEKLEQLLER